MFAQMIRPVSRGVFLFPVATAAAPHLLFPPLVWSISSRRFSSSSPQDPLSAGMDAFAKLEAKMQAKRKASSEGDSSPAEVSGDSAASPLRSEPDSETAVVNAGMSAFAALEAKLKA